MVFQSRAVPGAALKEKNTMQNGPPLLERPVGVTPGSNQNFTVATKIVLGTFSTGRKVSPATCLTVTGSLRTWP